MNNLKSKVTEDGETNNEPQVTLDTIIDTEIGQFGKFQIKALLLALIIIIFASWSETEYVLTTARIESRCVIPECDGPQPEWSPYWLQNAIPTSSSGLLDNCQRFGNISTLASHMENSTCPSILFDRNVLQPCEEYVYENTNTVVYDFGLACDEWSRSLFGTIKFLGIFFAQPITGYVSDRWGRRVALIINTFNTGWIGVARYWSNTYIGFILLQFFGAIFGGGAFNSVYILIIELMGPKYRVISGAVMNSFFAIGMALVGLISWGVPNWGYLTLILFAPQLLTLLYFWIMSESVRWYMSKGCFDASESLLKKMAETNGTQVAEKSLKSLRDTALLEANTKSVIREESGQESWLVVQVFQHKKILLRCIISPVWWITNLFVYYGLTINAVNLSGNKYLNFVAVSLVEIPGYWIAVFLMDKIGRKPVMIAAFWICSACQIAHLFIPLDLLPVWLTLYLVGKLAISMAMTALFIYTAELYPTNHRHTLFAFSSMTGSIGSALAPLTPAIGAQWFEELPFVLFACLALLSGGLVFLTPETVGLKLPDSFEEASQMGAKGNSFSK